VEDMGCEVSTHPQIFTSHHCYFTGSRGRNFLELRYDEVRLRGLAATYV
jgi:hypothetical protein